MNTSPPTPLSRRHLFLTAATSGVVAALTAGADGPRPDKFAPQPRDVADVDAILSAVYDVISGPKGQPRNWDRMRSLFVPEARLIPCVPKGADGKPAIRTLTVEEYISRVGPTLVAKGFVERQVSRRVDRFGHFAQVFSTYETLFAGETAVVGRGINGIQLFWDETRWWVATIMWDAETPTQRIPAEYEAKK
jgi:hypothetical protein